MRTWKDLQEIQPRVVPMLVSSIKKNRLTHAYLFEGEAGSGKMDVALQMAKSFFCKEQTGAEPCHRCVECKRIDHGNHPDIHRIAPDGASIKKEQIEFLQKEFAYRGMESASKVYVVSHVDKMTISAANSLLKFLEEPQGPTLALLLTEQGSQLLPTIRSRTQLFSFTPPSREAFAARLEEKGYSKQLAVLLAHIASNETEVAQINEGDWTSQARSVMLQLMQELYTRPEHAYVTLTDKWVPLLKERRQQELGLDMMFLWLKDLLYTQVGKQDGLIFASNQSQLEQLALSTSQLSVSQSMSKVMEARKQLNANVNIQLVMEKLLLTIREE
ncbi:DNA polymerase III subunit delta' [Shouchella shacheensis]|uniref:DNA polymerase III subunit delta' n=1 Tax=Shouchella shacheensis TaxID=1649580 RepID=UPI0007402D8A|nr:DNA polymerase III subunit delta' [Shouchella shacheensis]